MEQNRLREKVLSLLEIRGYQLTPEEKKGYMESNKNEKEFRGENGKSIIVYFSPDEKITKANVEEARKYANNENITIMIIGSDFASTSKNIFTSAVKQSKARFEFWKYSQLVINPLTHAMAPKYVILTPEQIRTEVPLFKNLDFQRSMEGFRDDPVIKWLGGKVGDVVRIHRYSDIMKTTISSYRLVRHIKVL